jgi:hypothetical protein
MPRDLFLIAMEDIGRPNKCCFNIEGLSKYENVKWLCEEHEKPSKEFVMAKLKELQDAEPMRLLRIERNKKLSATDKYMTLDYPMTEEQRGAMREYRQILRDLPQEGITIMPEPPEILKSFF